MKYSRLLKAAKNLSYSNKILECGSDARALYRLVNNLMGKSDVPTLPKQKLPDQSFAEEFSVYFSTKIADIHSPSRTRYLLDILKTKSYLPETYLIDNYLVTYCHLLKISFSNI
jgi:hypothetical protein